MMFKYQMAGLIAGRTIKLNIRSNLSGDVNAWCVKQCKGARKSKQQLLKRWSTYIASHQSMKRSITAAMSVV